jgi:hypothetical protein
MAVCFSQFNLEDKEVVKGGNYHVLQLQVWQEIEQKMIEAVVI